MTNSNLTKVVLVDFNCLLQLGNSAEYHTGIDAERITFNKLLNLLSLLGLKREDIIILACSGENSWRKEFYPDYSYTTFKIPIRYSTMITDATPFHIICLDNLENYDIISYATKYYEDREKIIVTTDDRFFLLEEVPNVKIVSPKTKRYRTHKNPQLMLLSLINKKLKESKVYGDMVATMYRNLTTVYNLLILPEKVEWKINLWLNTLNNDKEFNTLNCTYKLLRNKIIEIYGKKDMIKEKTTIQKRLVFK